MLGQTQHLWPFLLYLLLVVGMVGLILGVSYVLGQRHNERATGLPYESGMMPTGSARLRFSADLYLVAMFFVIFDLEAVLLFAWAVAVRELGWIGYAEAVVFMAILMAALAYLWRSGALSWAGPAKRPPPRPAERRVDHAPAP